MVDSKILIKVIEYCKYHHKAEQESLPEDEKTVWDKDFVKVRLPRRLPPRAPACSAPSSPLTDCPPRRLTMRRSST